MVVLVWPLLTLRYTGPAERLHGIDVRVLVVSSLLIVSLLTFGTLYRVTDWALQAAFDSEMKKLGEQIQTKIREELQDMFRPLAKLQTSIEKGCGEVLCTGNDQKAKDNITKKLPNELGQAQDLSKLVALLWVNTNGSLIRRWQLEPAPDEPDKWDLQQVDRGPSVKDRLYFNDAQAQLLWNFPLDDKDKNPGQFTLEVVQSRSTGKTTVVMAVPLSVTDQMKKPQVAQVSSRFPSLLQATLPLGFGFAVVDRTGQVLLHSDPRRDLNENILQECDDDDLIQSAMFAHRARYLNTYYYSEGYRFYIQPLNNTPWFVIVFHKKIFLQTANLTLLLGWSVLFFLYMGFWFIALLLVQLLFPHCRAEWMWPDRRRTGTYWWALGMVVLIPVACVATVCDAHALSRVTMLWIVPPLTLALLYLQLAQGQHRKYRRCGIWWVIVPSLLVVVFALDARTWWSLMAFLGVLSISVVSGLRQNSLHPHDSHRDEVFRWAYTCMLFSLLVSVIIVPAGFVFWDVQQQTMEALVKQSQLDYAEALQKRAERIRREQVDLGQPQWTDARFWTIWAQCTKPEKLALRQIAEEGFINPNNREVIRSLGHRLLIYRDPALLLRSESFRQFVQRAESPHMIARWEGETEASWISRLQGPLLVGVAAVAVFFLSTQQELYATVLAGLGTLTTILPRLGQLFGAEKGQRGASLGGGNAD